MKKVLMILLAVAMLSLGVAARSEAMPWPWYSPYWDPYWHPYWAPYGYAPPAVVLRQEPNVYMQRPAQQQYWYWCEKSKAYYPYVQECPTGWMQVVPQASPHTAPR